MSTDDVRKLEAIRSVVEAVKDNADLDWGVGNRLSYHAEDVPLQVGRADLLLIDDEEQVVYVVEVVPGEAAAEDVGRLMSLCGWMKTALPPDRTNTGPNLHLIASLQVKGVRGILLAQNFSAGAKSTMSLCPDLIAKTYYFALNLEEA
jgi:hypothetical protein